MVKEGFKSEATSSKRMVTEERPFFYKIFYPHFTAERLRIPPAFNKHILRDMSQHSHTIALLKGPAGGTWSVRLVTEANDNFLKDGWPEFVRDHSLGNDEFLLFMYKGNLRFDVQIFDANGLERATMPEPNGNGIQKRLPNPENHLARPNKLRQSVRAMIEKGKKEIQRKQI